MGSGSFDVRKYGKNTSTYVKQDKSQLFQKKIHSNFDPLNVKSRESCASKEHPHPTSIIITCDVTGSMGKIPENLLKGGLGKIMEALLKIQSISNPQLMFAAIGDTDYDQAPLQVTQFESDNRIEEQLKTLYLEGGGGGNNAESYHAIWYFAAYKTQLDMWKEGKKGLLFTMGDELVPDRLKAEHIRKFIDKDYKGSDVLTSELINEITKKYEVFHLIVQDTDTYRKMSDQVTQCWKKYLGERAISVSDHTKIPEKIITTIQHLCELASLKDKQLEKTQMKEEEKVKINVEHENVTSKLGLFKADSDHPRASSVSTLNKDSDGIPHLFICPISQEVMKNPVVAEDGYTYDEKNIKDWFSRDKNTSPKTNKIIGQLLIPNHDLKSEIIRWQENQASTLHLRN